MKRGDDFIWTFCDNGLFILLIFTLLLIKITIISQMLKKEQKRRLQPIIDFLDITMNQTNRQILSQEDINRGIVEQLLQSDAISHIQSIPALRLIVYELILLLSQQNGSKTGYNTENTAPIARMTNLMVAIKQILREMVEISQQNGLKMTQKRTVRQNGMGDRAYRNKHRIFITYFNQFCTLLDQTDVEMSHSKIGINGQLQAQPSKDQVLIDQLQHLVFKKQAQIQQVWKENEQCKNKIKNIEQQIWKLRSESQNIAQQNINLLQQNKKLRTQLKQLLQNNLTEADQKNLVQNQQEIETSNTIKSIWNQCSRKEVIFQEPPLQNYELMRLLLSQALTIQAIIS